MKKLCLLALLLLVLTSCGSSRKTTDTVVIGTSSSSTSDKKVNKIIVHAKSFEGTRYKFGGTTKAGMDCSGLVYTSFKKENIDLPRVSQDMAMRGKRIYIGELTRGDLIFFQTRKKGSGINHVGLVVEARNGKVRFIHSTSSRGVIISSLSERYWRDAYVLAKRII